MKAELQARAAERETLRLKREAFNDLLDSLQTADEKRAAIAKFT